MDLAPGVGWGGGKGGGAGEFGECAGDVLVPGVIEENNSGVKFRLFGATYWHRILGSC